VRALSERGVEKEHGHLVSPLGPVAKFIKLIEIRQARPDFTALLKTPPPNHVNIAFRARFYRSNMSRCAGCSAG
jgi:hypothetical protein